MSEWSSAVVSSSPSPAPSNVTSSSGKTTTGDSSSSGIGGGGGGMGSRRESIDSFDDTRSSSAASNHSHHNSTQDGAEYIPTRLTKASPKAPPNALQFVKVGPVRLFKASSATAANNDAEKLPLKIIPPAAVVAVHAVDENIRIKSTSVSSTSLHEDDWQSNLDNWKCARRKRVEDVIERVTEIKKYESDDTNPAEHSHRRKTFNEMIEQRSARQGGRVLNIHLYPDSDEEDIRPHSTSANESSSSDCVTQQTEPHSEADGDNCETRSSLDTSDKPCRRSADDNDKKTSNSSNTNSPTRASERHSRLPPSLFSGEEVADNSSNCNDVKPATKQTQEKCANANESKNHQMISNSRLLCFDTMKSNAAVRTPVAAALDNNGEMVVSAAVNRIGSVVEESGDGVRPPRAVASAGCRDVVGRRRSLFENISTSGCDDKQPMAGVDKRCIIGSTSRKVLNNFVLNDKLVDDRSSTQATATATGAPQPDPHFKQKLNTFKTMLNSSSMDSGSCKPPPMRKHTSSIDVKCIGASSSAIRKSLGDIRRDSAPNCGLISQSGMSQRVSRLTEEQTINDDIDKMSPQQLIRNSSKHRSSIDDVSTWQSTKKCVDLTTSKINNCDEQPQQRQNSAKSSPVHGFVQQFNRSSEQKIQGNVNTPRATTRNDDQSSSSSKRYSGIGERISSESAASAAVNSRLFDDCLSNDDKSSRSVSSPVRSPPSEKPPPPPAPPSPAEQHFDDDEDDDTLRNITQITNEWATTVFKNKISQHNNLNSFDDVEHEAFDSSSNGVETDDDELHDEQAAITSSQQLRNEPAKPCQSSGSSLYENVKHLVSNDEGYNSCNAGGLLERSEDINQQFDNRLKSRSKHDDMMSSVEDMMNLLTSISEDIRRSSAAAGAATSSHDKQQVAATAAAESDSRVVDNRAANKRSSCRAASAVRANTQEDDNVKQQQSVGNITTCTKTSPVKTKLSPTRSAVGGGGGASLLGGGGGGGGGGSSYLSHWLVQEAEQRRITDMVNRKHQPPIAATANGSSSGSSSQSLNRVPSSSSSLSSLASPSANNHQSIAAIDMQHTKSSASPPRTAIPYATQQQQHQQPSSPLYANISSCSSQPSNVVSPRQHLPEHITSITSRVHGKTKPHQWRSDSRHEELPVFPAAATKSTSHYSREANSNAGVNSGGMDDDEKVLSVSGKKKCAHCGDELGRGAAMIIESLNLCYHLLCFRCCVCHCALGDGRAGADVRVRNRRLHCQSCYSTDHGLKYSQV